MAQKKKRGRGGPRPGAGRPSKPTDERQSERVLVSLTPEEKRALAAAAGEEPLGSYVRQLLVRHLARRQP
jgi:hypothetical protein